MSAQEGQSWLEKKEAERAAFGSPENMGQPGDNLLEISQTNKVTVDPNQSRWWQAGRILSQALETEAVNSDVTSAGCWDWLLELVEQSEKHQLTMGGYSREQNLKVQTATQVKEQSTMGIMTGQK